ncbi:TIGR03032 family protein [Gemmobacter serpentinus]|uniref:TIGR03032 family protein n=1 Tax=Gemmobacter serpentinus TaxID=2652247 RepID=UPI0021F53A6A|nr:TIGR03032 family protein [Gemmobacter serpentinus]
MVFVGSPPDGGAATGQERAFARAMGFGFSADLRQMYLATQRQIYRFDNFLRPGAQHKCGSDAVFVPRLSWVSGDLDANDISAMASPVARRSSRMRRSNSV